MFAKQVTVSKEVHMHAMYHDNKKSETQRSSDVNNYYDFTIFINIEPNSETILAQLPHHIPMVPIYNSGKNDNKYC